MIDYQKQAKLFCLPQAYNQSYLTLGLAAEAGEVAGKLAKYIRDDVSFPQFKKDIVAELGDVLWFVAVLSDFYGVSLEDIAKQNIEKLSSRKQRNAIQGSGDTR